MYSWYNFRIIRSGVFVPLSNRSLAGRWSMQFPSIVMPPAGDLVAMAAVS